MADVRDLYGLPLERFTAERSALAKELRASGQPDEAARIAKLRKPSVAAWAVNQLVRTQRAAVGELFDAGDELRSAHGELLAGRGDPGELRRVSDRERAAVQQFIATARGLLSSEGHGLSAAMLERVGETLHAAALDPDVRAKVADGCLERELRHVGLGAGPTPRTPSKAPRKRDTRIERERAERLKAARKAAADARREAQRAARELRAAEQRRDRAAAALDEAEAELSEAQRRAAEADRAQQETERALADAGAS